MRATRKRGRKKPHSQPLSDVKAAAAMIVFNDVRSRNNWSERRACDEIQNAVDLPKIRSMLDSELGKTEFAIDISTFRKVFNVDLSLNHCHKWAIYLWAKAIFREDLSQRITE